MASTKKKITVTIDQRLVDEMELHDESISAQVNDAIESAIDGRRRRRNLLSFLDALDAEHGPSSPADLAEFRELFFMMLVLDSEAVNALATRTARMHRVKAALRAAVEAGADVVVPTVVLAELYRGSAHNAAINSMLSREQADLTLRDTDRPLASYVGGVLAASDAGSEDIVDAHCVAAVVERGRGVVLTADEADLTRLAAPYPTVTVRGI